MDEVSQEEHEDLNFSNQKLPSTHYQNVSHVQMHHEHKEYIPLEEVMEEQGTVCEKMCEPLIDKSHIAGTIPATTQSVATEDRIQSVTSGAFEEKSESYSITLPETTVMSFQKQNVPKKAEVCHLDQKLDMRESKSIPHVQCDPETARNEPFVEPDRVGISEDKKQGMDEVSQKEPKLPADHFQNGSPVQIQNDNKDGIPLEGAMEEQANICEPHTSPQKSNVSKEAEDLQASPCHEPDHKTDTPLEQPLNMLRSITQMPCIQETAINEPISDSDQVMDEVSQNEHGGSNFSNQELPPYHYQNISPVQIQHDDKEYIQLEKAMEVQGTVCELNMQSVAELSTKKMREPLMDRSNTESTIPTTTQNVATDDRIQSVAPGASEEECESHSITLLEATGVPTQKPNFLKQAEALCHPDQKLDLLESKSIPHVQCKPETARNEPVVKSDCTEDRREGMDEVSQREQELPDNHFQNGSPVQIQNDDKGRIPFEEAMEAQANICEPHTSPQKSNVSKEADDLQASPCHEPDHKTDTPLEQPLNMLKSITQMPCIQETAINEPIFDSDQVMDEVSQEEHGGSNCSKQELPPYHYQNISPAQIQHDNKDGTSLAEGLFSMPVSDSGKITGKAKRQPRNTSKLRSEHRRLLYDWALKKCSSKEEIEKVFDCISIQNQVEHGEYPCFVAENIMIYTDPKNGDKQIIVTDDKNKDVKNNLPKEITFIPEYQMWVCGIKKAVVIRNLEERELRFKSFDLILQSCKELVFEALAPALAVFKHIQRQERLYSLTKDH
ncbi:uncharacterized protein LOC103029852 isoform X1 [Astyanax mexicanus]|uniref:uncharacterized protein LOC103029852 isoform X1 n=1 Tax=Astyanax mexicanus TaxID=7994 RepID=UPI0020CAFAFB|nr:uncharacterized protein LOC103029852 isoform X1 [Astyanax mexicanus]